MDISTLIGFIVGLVAMIVSILLAGAELMLFFDPPSIFIVFGGLISALLISYPMDQVIAGLKSISIAFKNITYDPSETIEQVNGLAQAARKDGLLALEDMARKMEDPFLKKGVMLVVDGTEPELVRSILETESIFLETRHKSKAAFWEAVAEQGPAWGMVGTLIGLIAMLADLDDPTTIGPKMGVALITTLYGSVIANYIGNPVAAKLKNKNDQEIVMKQIVIEGLLAIQAGENPRVIEEKLKAFLAPSARGTSEGERE